MENVLKKNNRLKILRNISKIMNVHKTKEKYIPGYLTVDDISYFKYTPVTSVDVKRTFYLQKSFIRQRRSFLFKNIKQHTIIQWNCNRFSGSKKKVKD